MKPNEGREQKNIGGYFFWCFVSSNKDNQEYDGSGTTLISTTIRTNQIVKNKYALYSTVLFICLYYTNQ